MKRRMTTSVSKNLPTPAPTTEMRECVTFKHPGITHDMLTPDDDCDLVAFENAIITGVNEDGDYVLNTTEIPVFDLLPLSTSLSSAAGNDTNPSIDCCTYANANPEFFNTHVEIIRRDNLDYFISKYETMIQHLIYQARKVVIDLLVDDLKALGVEYNTERRLLHFPITRFRYDKIRIMLEAYSSGDIDINKNAFYDNLAAMASHFISDACACCVDTIMRIVYEDTIGKLDITEADALYAKSCEMAYDAFYSYGRQIFNICKSAAGESYLVYLSMYPDYELPARERNIYIDEF